MVVQNKTMKAQRITEAIWKARNYTNPMDTRWLTMTLKHAFSNAMTLGGLLSSTTPFVTKEVTWSPTSGLSYGIRNNMMAADKCTMLVTVSPGAPGAPCRPGRPLSPWGPCSPVLPSFPGGPCSTTTHTIFISMKFQNKKKGFKERRGFEKLLLTWNENRQRYSKKFLIMRQSVDSSVWQG